MTIQVNLRTLGPNEAQVVLSLRLENQAECTQCSTTAQYTGSATEVNAALREFKEIHKDCNSGKESTVDSAKAKPVVKIHEVI
jgi:hypothetical protein